MMREHGSTRRKNKEGKQINMRTASTQCRFRGELSTHVFWRFTLEQCIFIYPRNQNRRDFQRVGRSKSRHGTVSLDWMRCHHFFLTNWREWVELCLHRHPQQRTILRPVLSQMLSVSSLVQTATLVFIERLTPSHLETRPWAMVTRIRIGLTGEGRDDGHLVG